MHSTVDSCLTGELDFCYRARVKTMVAYCDPQPGDRILDCGCGRGFMLQVINAIADCDLYGCESEQYDPVLDMAQTALAGNAEIRRADVVKGLPYADEQFDKVILSEVLEHLSDPVRALQELYRVLKPGGTLAMTVPNSRYPFAWDPVNWVLERVWGQPIRHGFFSGIWTHHERLYSRAELENTVRDQGFSIAATDLLTYHCLPFSHNLLYGVGKGLVERGIVSGLDRLDPERPPSPRSSPWFWLEKFLEGIDRLNTRFPPRRASVCIAMKLTKPMANVG